MGVRGGHTDQRWEIKRATVNKVYLGERQRRDEGKERERNRETEREIDPPRCYPRTKSWE